MTKPTKWYVRPAKTDQPGHQPSPIRVFALRSVVAKDPSFLHADSEDFAGHTCHFVCFVMRRLNYDH